MKKPLFSLIDIKTPRGIVKLVISILSVLFVSCLFFNLINVIQDEEVVLSFTGAQLISGVVFDTTIANSASLAAMPLLLALVIIVPVCGVLNIVDIDRFNVIKTIACFTLFTFVLGCYPHINEYIVNLFGSKHADFEFTLFGDIFKFLLVVIAALQGYLLVLEMLDQKENSLILKIVAASLFGLSLVSLACNQIDVYSYNTVLSLKGYQLLGGFDFTTAILGISSQPASIIYIIIVFAVILSIESVFVNVIKNRKTQDFITLLFIIVAAVLYKNSASTMIEDTLSTNASATLSPIAYLFNSCLWVGVLVQTVRFIVQVKNYKEELPVYGASLFALFALCSFFMPSFTTYYHSSTYTNYELFYSFEEVAFGVGDNLRINYWLIASLVICLVTLVLPLIDIKRKKMLMLISSLLSIVSFVFMVVFFKDGLKALASTNYYGEIIEYGIHYIGCVILSFVASLYVGSYIKLETK